MKKLLVFIVFVLACLMPANAVLKERDLARTLGVLKAELQARYEQQQTFMAMYEQSPEFDDMDDEFVEKEEEWTEQIAHYIDEHIEKFAIIQ